MMRRPALARPLLHPRLAFAAALAALAFLATIPAALAAAPTPPGGIPVVTGTLDFGAAEGSAERAESASLLEAFPAAPGIVYLDLAIAPLAENPGTETEKLDFRTSLYGPDGKAIAESGCAAGNARFYGPEIGSLSVSTGALYPHLLLDVELAAPGGAPFNSLSCAYAPSLPGMVVLRLAGFFVVHDVSIPEARQIRLVPYTPPYDQALDALGRSHAYP